MLSKIWRLWEVFLLFYCVHFLICFHLNLIIKSTEIAFEMLIEIDDGIDCGCIQNADWNWWWHWWFWKEIEIFYSEWLHFLHLTNVTSILAKVLSRASCQANYDWQIHLRRRFCSRWKLRLQNVTAFGQTVESLSPTARSPFLVLYTFVIEVFCT